VRRALTDINGVTVDEVELGIAKVHYNASMTSASAITQAVEEEGYAVVSAA
jgi:copper chaperone CopZ